MVLNRSQEFSMGSIKQKPSQREIKQIIRVEKLDLSQNQEEVKVQRTENDPTENASVSSLRS